MPFDSQSHSQFLFAHRQIIETGGFDSGERTSTKRPWTSEEDALVMQLVHRHGLKSWSSLANYFHGRSGKQVGLLQVSRESSTTARIAWGTNVKRWGRADSRALAQSARPSHSERSMVILVNVLKIALPAIPSHITSDYGMAACGYTSFGPQAY